MLLMQLLMTFTKQIWFFLFYVLYPHGHFHTVIRGEEEAPETHQVRVILCRRVALPCDCHSPADTQICLCEAVFMWGHLWG